MKFLSKVTLYLMIVCCCLGLGIGIGYTISPIVVASVITSSATSTKSTVTVGSTAMGGVVAAKMYETDGTFIGGKASPSPGAVTGLVWVPMATSTPTGTPSPVQSGYAAVVVSSGDHKIYTWDGSGWTGR